MCIRDRGVSPPAVSKWETESSYPDVTLLSPIARALGITVDILLSFQEELTEEEVDSLYKSDNCASRSEFMEKALQFYIGYLACSHAQDYLAQVIPSTVKGIMDETANRMGRLMFKMAVEQAVTENILAAVCSVDQQDLTRLRGQCIEEIRKTNGLLSFDKALSWQRDG